jgi:hypothetical protein
MPQLVMVPPPLLLAPLLPLLPPLLLLLPLQARVQNVELQLATSVSSCAADAGAAARQLLWHVPVVQAATQLKMFAHAGSLLHVVSCMQQFCVLHCAHAAVL